MYRGQLAPDKTNQNQNIQSTWGLEASLAWSDATKQELHSDADYGFSVCQLAITSICRLTVELLAAQVDFNLLQKTLKHLLLK